MYEWGKVKKVMGNKTGITSYSWTVWQAYKVRLRNQLFWYKVGCVQQVKKFQISQQVKTKPSKTKNNHVLTFYRWTINLVDKNMEEILATFLSSEWYFRYFKISFHPTNTDHFYRWTRTTEYERNFSYVGKDFWGRWSAAQLWRFVYVFTRQL